MPVRVQCSRCSTTLELDDGFRGGVCRCKECGALLQVPRSSSEGAAKVRPMGPVSTPSPAKQAAPERKAGQAETRTSAGAAESTLSDPRSNSYGGSAGSGLPRPAPVAHAPKRRKTDAAPKETTRQTLPVSTPTASRLTQVHRNNFLLRLSILLGVLIAVVVLLLVAHYLFR